MSLTPQDAVELISLCDKASEDLRKFDQGVSYRELHIGRTFATITEPLKANNDLVHELRNVVPATALLALKRAIGQLSVGAMLSRGQAEQAYAHPIAVLKEALLRLTQTQAANAEAEAEAEAEAATVRSEPAPEAAVSAFPPVENLLHPAIVEHAVPLFRNGHLRDAVLNGVLAVFDLIRARTGLGLDGKELVGQAFGMENGHLIFSEVESVSGKNDQKGFMMIFEGVYTGVRNVKAHSLSHDLTEAKTIQYLVTLSLLARRVEECRPRT